MITPKTLNFPKYPDTLLFAIGIVFFGKCSGEF